MHELSIVMNIIDIAEENARRENASVITEIELDIGQQAGVVMEALEFAFAAAKRGTMLEKAKWVANEVPALARCTLCRHEYAPRDQFFLCPECDSPFSEVLQGRELRVKAIKVE